MPRCTRQGCGQEFDEANNVEGSCSYHSGGPVFHEGLKSWSCCKDVNKPVLEFDAFMKLPGCTKSVHTSVAPIKATPPPKSETVMPAPTMTNDGKEVYGTAPTKAAPPASSDTPVTTTTSAPSPPPAQPVVQEEDDLDLPVPPGAICKRKGCGAKYESDQVSRGSGEKSVCHFHPLGPIFHEGSKGYLCCKRRVLDFSDFLNITGCTEGKHLFVGAKKSEEEVAQEELVSCRLDHYQTPLQVHVSAFAKGVNAEASSVSFDEDHIHLDLRLPGNKRVLRSVAVYGPIKPAECKYSVRDIKVEITLEKTSALSWPLLEKPGEGKSLPPGFAITFGTKGRTGTVGGKEIYLAPEEVARREAEKQQK